jgi:hypothetical protein
MLSSRACACGRDPIEPHKRRSIALVGAFLWAAIMMGPVWGSAHAEQQSELTLSQSAPQAIFPLDEERVNKGETTVLVRLVRAENPDHIDFTVDVSLADCRAGAESSSTAIGSLGVYPAGQVGGSYALDLGPGLKRMLAHSYETGQICLKLQLKPLRTSANLKNLRVTLTRPEWKMPPRS